MGSMFDYLWIFHALYSRCRMAHFCNILPTGCKLRYVSSGFRVTVLTAGDIAEAVGGFG